MSRLVCYIPSYNDSPFVAESLSSSPDWEVVISDNASDEPHRSALAALASPRVQVVRQEKSLGRVGNWKFCVEHFIASRAQWMKLLSAGDLHKAGSCDIFRRAIDRCPQAGCIVPRVENVWPHQRFVFQLTNQETLMRPAELMQAMVTYGNIFHSGTAPLFHLDTVKDGFSFGEGALSFCADMMFMLGIARKSSVLFIAEVAVEFIAERRKNMQAGINTLEHYLEEALVRLRAADAYLALTGDRQRRNQMLASIVDMVRTDTSEPLDKLTGDSRYSAEELTKPVPHPELPPARYRPGE